MLQETFTDLTLEYTDDTRLIAKLWNEIERGYSGKHRHYHTLAHLENLLTQLGSLRTEIGSWNTILFTLFYHDIIYNARKSDNEEASADLARDRMRLLSVSGEEAEHCVQQILATKTHLPAASKDTNIFTDADLSILGKDWPTYSDYCRQVRKEYSIYPDLIYKPGRRKVLRHFLQMERIYKTDFFYEKYEKTAKKNLQRELEQL